MAVSSHASKERVDRLRQAGANVIPAGRNKVNLRTLLSRLHQLGIRSVLLEGGGTLNWSMLSNRLVDDVVLTIAPFIIGGYRATTLVDGEGISKVNRAIRLTLVKSKRQNDEVVLSYRMR